MRLGSSDSPTIAIVFVDLKILSIIFGYSYHWMRNGYYLEDLNADDVAHLSDLEKQFLDIRLSDNPNYRAKSNSYPLTEWAEKHGVVPEDVTWTVEV